MRLEQIAVADLRLDPKNPRLPEDLRGAEETSILEYLRNEEALDELAQSFVDNGYFESDPLIVVRQEDGQRNVVVEGNRRLATLKILLGEPAAGDFEFTTIEASEDQLGRLRTVPCFVVDSRSEVSRFIGFRHIGGLRLWPPEAKARYVLEAVDGQVAAGDPEPFRSVGKQVGSNAQGIRSLYTAISILKFAREEFGLQVGELQSNRFGVWLRALNSPDIKAFIGLPPNFRTFAEVNDALGQLKQEELKQVISDLSPADGKRAVVTDSRMITDYGRILMQERARSVFRKSGDFEAARQIIESTSLIDRVVRIADACAAIVEDVSQQEDVDVTPELLAQTSRLSTSARSLNDLLKARNSSDE